MNFLIKLTFRAGECENIFNLWASLWLHKKCCIPSYLACWISFSQAIVFVFAAGRGGECLGNECENLRCRPSVAQVNEPKQIYLLYLAQNYTKHSPL